LNVTVICPANDPVPREPTWRGLVDSLAVWPCPSGRVLPLQARKPASRDAVAGAAVDGGNEATVWMTAAGLLAGLRKATLVRKADPWAVIRWATQLGAPVGLTAAAAVERVHPVGRSPTPSTLGSSWLFWAEVSGGVVVVVVDEVEVEEEEEAEVAVDGTVVVVAEDDELLHPASRPPTAAITPTATHEPRRRLIGPAASTARWPQPPLR
jgi:hypothetical protein